MKNTQFIMGYEPDLSVEWCQHIFTKYGIESDAHTTTTAQLCKVIVDFEERLTRIHNDLQRAIGIIPATAIKTER